MDAYQNLYKGPEHKVDAWKKTFSVSVVKEIEKLCDKAIETFGYNKTWSVLNLESIWNDKLTAELK